MTSTAVLRRRTRAGAVLALAAGALLALIGLAVAGTVTADGGAHTQTAPFSFD